MGSAGKKKTVTYNVESVNRPLTKNNLIVLCIHTQNESGVVQHDHSGIHICLVHSCSWMILCLIHQMVPTYSICAGAFLNKSTVLSQSEIHQTGLFHLAAWQLMRQAVVPTARTLHSSSPLPLRCLMQSSPGM